MVKESRTCAGSPIIVLCALAQSSSQSSRAREHEPHTACAMNCTRVFCSHTRATSPGVIYSLQSVFFFAKEFYEIVFFRVISCTEVFDAELLGQKVVICW